MSSRTNHPQQADQSETQWKRWALLAAVALLLIVVVQNSQEVEVNLLFVSTTSPLILLLLATALLGAAIGYFGPIVRRGREKD